MRRTYAARVVAEWIRGKHAAGERTAFDEMIDSGVVPDSQWQDGWRPREVFDTFVKSFEDGEFDVTRTTHEGGRTLTHRYFLGGVEFEKVALQRLSAEQMQTSHSGTPPAVKKSISEPVTLADGPSGSAEPVSPNRSARSIGSGTGSRTPLVSGKPCGQWSSSWPCTWSGSGSAVPPAAAPGPDRFTLFARIYMKLRPVLLVLAVAATTLTACASEGSNGSGGAGKAESTPVSWPTPENGKLTPELCGLLTVGDFIKLDVATTPLTGGPAPDYGPNAVYCRSLDGNGLLLSLQPDAVSASLFYRAELNRHNEAMASRKVKGSAVEEDGIVDAAESWFDLNEVALPKYPEYDLSARRGSLVVNLHLAARENGDAARAQARTRMATLIGLVLERAPGLGEETTGAPHIMTMTVQGSGTGPVDIQYFDPVTGKLKRVSEVTLPGSSRCSSAGSAPGRSS